MPLVDLGLMPNRQCTRQRRISTDMSACRNCGGDDSLWEIVTGECSQRVFGWRVMFRVHFRDA